jgi:hypothetical protein
VEACIPTLFFLILASLPGGDDSLAHYKSLALNFYHRWREWNKDRALQFCLQSFAEADPIRKACKAEILAAVLFQRCGAGQMSDKVRTESIMSVFLNSRYQYLLQNYLQTYYYHRPTPEGEQFSRLLKDYGITK